MEYIEIKLSGLSGDTGEILAAEMCELGFESFSEETGGVMSAFIPSDTFDMMKTANFLENRASASGFRYTVERIAEQNWNAVWESAYQPVKIGSCFIRAPFHEPDPEAEIDLVIEPKMSFGTAHHETTRLMIKALLKISFEGSSVLDMGTGTGVLGIIAAKLGAQQVVAIDNDEWSFLNARENADRNNVTEITVIQGESGDIPAGKYNYILANINRNVLLSDIPVYTGFLADDGVLVISGFYKEDMDVINKVTVASGLIQKESEILNHWAAVTYKKC